MVDFDWLLFRDKCQNRKYLKESIINPDYASTTSIYTCNTSGNECFSKEHCPRKAEIEK
jgi:hypothetical protein